MQSFYEVKAINRWQMESNRCKLLLRASQIEWTSRQEPLMRKWYLSITVLGVGGLSAFLLSDLGRDLLRGLLGQFREAPNALADWNDGVQTELDRIEAALNQLAESLQPRRELGS